jgi:hypothetical protein
VFGVGANPPTSIGQRALLFQAPPSNVLWDMISYIGDMVAAVKELVRVSAIASSHPHF